MDETKQPGEANLTHEPEAAKPKSRKGAKADEAPKEEESSQESTDPGRGKKSSAVASEAKGADDATAESKGAASSKNVNPAERMRFRRKPRH